MRGLRGLLLAVVVVLAAGAFSGCHYHGHRYAHAHVAPRVVLAHTHYAGCGHYYWHGGWFVNPHPYDCSCRPSYRAPRVSIAIGSGHGYRHRQYASRHHAPRRACR